MGANLSEYPETRQLDRPAYDRSDQREPRWRVQKVPIGYGVRSRSEGKNVGVRDAAVALHCIVRYALAD